MTDVAYIPTCLLCGGALSPTAQGPHSPPWHCSPCFWSWWTAQLTKAARDSFRPDTHDFSDPTIADAVDAEVAEAAQRGTSLRLDQVDQITPTVAASLRSGFRLTSDIDAALAAIQ
jgi:hypothetical protein